MGRYRYTVVDAFGRRMPADTKRQALATQAKRGQFLGEAAVWQVDTFAMRARVLPAGRWGAIPYHV